MKQHLLGEVLQHPERAPTVTAAARWVAPFRMGLDGFWRLTVIRCPFCRGRHLHGGGSGLTPSTGHRVADCDRGTGYYLALPAPLPVRIAEEGGAA